MGALGWGEGFHSHDWIWGPLTYFDTWSKTTLPEAQYTLHQKKCLRRSIMTVRWWRQWLGILFVSLFHTHIDIIPPILNGTTLWREGYWEICHGTWNLLIKNTLSFHISKNAYLFKHAPSHTVSNISTFTQTWCHINTPFLRVRYEVKKCRKVTQAPCTTRYDIVTTLQKTSKWLFKPVHNHFPKPFTTCQILFLHIPFMV